MNFFNLQMTIYATLFTWFVTALGAAIVFLFKKVNEKIMSFTFGFGAGVMIAASIFSLIIPGIELSLRLNQSQIIPVSIGFAIGGLLLILVDYLLSYLKNKKNVEVTNSLNRKFLLVLAITLHNIPEGLAIGVAFGSINNGTNIVTLASAWLLAIGIGIQNFPEGIAVSVPLKSEGMSNKKSFWYGQLSGMVEPISAIIGFILVTIVEPMLPYILGFAAGAMFYVVAEELIPSSKTTKGNKLGTIGVMMGFLIMMALDVILG